MSYLFENRRDAGQRLVPSLQHLKGKDPIVLGLARGGLVLAAEIAEALSAPMDVLVVRKVGAPHHPEYGIGAVAPKGTRVFDPVALERLGLSEYEFNRLADRELEEVDRRLSTYRSTADPPEVRGRTAIVADDGLATGVTAKAACRYVRGLEPAYLALAVPVCSSEARDALQDEVDEFICLAEPEPFYAVGQWYRDFDQVEDAEVLELLGANR